MAGWLATISGLGLILIGLLTPSGFFFYFLGPLVLTVGLVAGAGNQALERRARGAPYPGPSPYLVLLTIVPATFAIGVAIGSILRAILGPTDVPDSVANLVGVAIQAVVFIGIVRLTVVGTDALTWAQMGWRRLNGEGVRALLLGAATSIPVIGLTAVVAAIVVGLFHEIPESPLPPTGTALGLVIQLLAGAVIAPIAEETVFRGFAITAWERTVGEQGALVRSSLLFALAHVITVSGSSLGEVAGLIVVGFATRLPVGFALGWLYLRTRSIWAPIGLHMTFNGILLVLAEVAKASGAA